MKRYNIRCCNERMTTQHEVTEKGDIQTIECMSCGMKTECIILDKRVKMLYGQWEEVVKEWKKQILTT